MARVRRVSKLRLVLCRRWSLVRGRALAVAVEPSGVRGRSFGRHQRRGAELQRAKAYVVRTPQEAPASTLLCEATVTATTTPTVESIVGPPPAAITGVSAGARAWTLRQAAFRRRHHHRVVDPTMDFVLNVAWTLALAIAFACDQASRALHMGGAPYVRTCVVPWCPKPIA